MDTWFCRQSVGPPLENGLQPTTQVTRIKLAIVMLEAHAANVILSEYTSFFGGGVEEVFLGMRKTINRLDIRSCSNLAARQPTLLHCQPKPSEVIPNLGSSEHRQLQGTLLSREVSESGVSYRVLVETLS